MSPIAEFIIDISSNIDKVLMMSKKKKNPRTYPGFVKMLKTIKYCYDLLISNVKKAKAINEIESK